MSVSAAIPYEDILAMGTTEGTPELVGVVCGEDCRVAMHLIRDIERCKVVENFFLHGESLR